MTECASSIERGLTAVGVTAVEDELQDEVQEEVQDTRKFLREARIKIWMLTGDKLEAASLKGSNPIRIRIHLKSNEAWN